MPDTDVDSSAFRSDVSPLNKPADDVSPEIRAAARSASTDAFHLAALVSAGLLLVGAAINAVGIRNPGAEGRHAGPGGEQPPGEGVGAGGPVRGSAETFASGEHRPHEPTGPARDP